MNGKVVYILGAGASSEANLPTGYTLKKSISEMLNLRVNKSKESLGDSDIYIALRNYTRSKGMDNNELNTFVESARHISDALPYEISIDNFIDTQRGNEKIAICGKLAIVKAILKAEKNSILYFDPNRPQESFRVNSLESTWFLPFFQLIRENCELNDLEKRFQSIAIINFNYDRCIEHFLYNSLKNFYRITPKESAQIVNNIEIFHPYGTVGQLPWQENGENIDFGFIPEPNRLVNLANNIKTFTEGTNPKSSEIKAIKEHIRNADKLVFLGFAFHKLNMKLLSSVENQKTIKVQSCFATTHGISKSDTQEVGKEIKALSKNKILVDTNDTTCRNFFSEYWRSLAF